MVDLTTKSPQELYTLAVAYRRLAVQNAETFPRLTGEPKRLAWVKMLHCNDMAQACFHEIDRRIAEGCKNAEA